MTPPLPAVSRPSKTTTTRRPLWRTHSSSCSSSTWSRRSSLTYSPLSSRRCLFFRTLAIAGRLCRYRLRQVKLSRPVVERCVDVDDPGQARLLEQARGDAGPVADAAVHRHRGAAGYVGRMVRHVGDVHVHGAGHMA